MPKDNRKFVNPLTQPSQPATHNNTETSTDTNTYTSTSLEQVQHRKRGAQAFEKTHDRITLWIDKGLRQQFDQLADEEGKAKTTLLNEAIADLLKKHGKQT